MSRERPQWVSKERKTVNSLWSIGSNSTQQGRAASLDDFDTKAGNSLLSEARHDTDRNYEDIITDNTYVPNVDVKTIEIVKRNGCYTIQEDGRTRFPTALSRDETILSDESLQALRELEDDRNNDRNTSSNLEMRMAVEALKGGNEAQANYTIGEARVRDVEEITATPFVSPVAFRVRLEDRELPPTRCVLSVRSVVVKGFDTVSRLQSVADYSVNEIGDVPISSVSDPTTGALLFPYPASVTTPLSTKLISKRRVRDAMDAARKASYVSSEILLPPNKTKEAAEASLRWRLLAAVFPKADPLVRAFGALYTAAKGIAMTATVRLLAYLHTKRRFEDAMSNTSYEYFTYGRASISVFADLAYDIHAICDYVEKANPNPSFSDKVVNSLTAFLGRRIPEGETRLLYDTLSPRERELAEFFSGREQMRDQKLLKTPSNRPGTVLAYARSEDELNEADPSFLRKEAQLYYRVDTYFDIEIWDPQFSDIIRISVAPGLQAGLEAGRLVQTFGGRLKDDFYTLVDAQNRLIRLKGTNGMKDIFPESIYKTDGVDSNDGTLWESNNDVLQQFRVGRRLRQLLGLPPLKEDGTFAWELAQDPNSDYQPKLDTKQDIVRGDFENLPFFARNRVLETNYTPYNEYDRMQYALEVTDDKASAAKRKSFTTLGEGLLLRTLSQLVIPEYRLYSTRVDSATAFELSNSVSNDFHIKQTFAACLRVRRELDKKLRTFCLEERGADASDAREARRRMRFATIYDMKDLPPDAAQTITSKLGKVYTSSIRTTLPFSSMYPDAVGVQMAASFVADQSQNKAMEIVTGEEENTVQIARVEAMEAFSSVIVDTLGARNVFVMSTKDLSNSVVTTSKRRLRAAALLIKRIFVQENGAVVNWDDDLMWLMPDSVYALIALNHASCWHYRWDRTSIVQGRKVWTTQLNVFANELLKLSRSTTHPLKLLPLLNVQSTWVSARKSAPYDFEAARASVEQAVTAFSRVTSIAKAIGGMSDRSDERRAFTLRSLSHAVQDTVLSRPIVWRMSENELRNILDDIKTRKLTADPVVEQTVRPITHEELEHAWARRRIYVDEDLQDIEVPVDISFLSNELSACNLTAGEEEECVYYVPVCCDSLPNMANPYDATLSLQLLLCSRLNQVALKISSLKFAKTETVVEGTNIVISIRSPSKNNRPTNPLLIHTDVIKANTGAVVSNATPVLHVYVCMTPQVDAVYDGLMREQTTPFTESNNNALQYLYADDISSLLSAMSTDNLSETSSYAMLHNARRTLMFATDRMYQALLYARLIEPTGAMKIVIDLTNMAVANHSCSDDSLLKPDNAPIQVGQQSNRNMASLSLLLALALLPEDLSDGLSFTILSTDTDANDLAELISTVASNMKTTGIESVTLGEIVACIVHKCL